MSADLLRTIPHVSDLDGVVVASKALAASLPPDLEELRSEIVIEYGQREERRRLVERRFPGISPDYVSVISSLNLDGVSVGLFHGFEKSESAEELGEWIERITIELKSKCVVCWYEADPVLVSLGGSSDEVTVLNHSTGIEYPIARSFSELLVLASNLVAARVLGTGASGAKQSIEEILVGEEQLQAIWAEHIRSSGLT